uniref:Uncharacterized protein n=1 Tax=viral metagenome TaxID=1070528 RepID=A0A6M3LVP2_9ZZZZ
MCNVWYEGADGARRCHKPGVAWKAFVKKGNKLMPSYKGRDYTLQEGDTLKWDDSKVRPSQRPVSPGAGFFAYASERGLLRHLRRLPADVGHRVHYDQPIGTMRMIFNVNDPPDTVIVFREFTVGEQVG